MRGTRVDPHNRTVRVQPGCQLGDLDHATHAFGLATVGGVISTTGVAGLTLGGGMGYLTRGHGLTIDNLLSADIVTANGELVHASENENADLFWAIRGGGGNFGVVTAFEYKLHPVGDIFGGPTFYRIDAEVLRNYRELIAEAPEDLGAIFAFAQAPPLPFVPEAWLGEPVMAVITCWTGPGEKDDDITAAISDLGPVVGQALWRMPYPVINTLFDELLPAGLYHYWKANFARELSEEAVAAHLQHGVTVPSLESGTFILPIDGACQRMASERTAFAHRDCAWSVVIAGTWQDAADNEKNTAWVRDYYEALRPHSEEGGYVNFMSGDDIGRVSSNYGANFARLQAVKAKHDPSNLFRMNQNIAPTAAPGA
jgi:FAD/FMN-containing dehydrogenase